MGVDKNTAEILLPLQIEINVNRSKGIDSTKALAY